MKLLLSDFALRTWGERIKATQGDLTFVTAEQALADGACDADLAFMTREVTGKSSSGNPTPELRGFDTVLVGGTHEVHGYEFCRDKKGIVYAMGPTVRHTKGQHLTAYGDNDGWHSIRVADEAATWEWGVRLGD